MTEAHKELLRAHLKDRSPAGCRQRIAEGRGDASDTIIAATDEARRRSIAARTGEAKA